MTRPLLLLALLAGCPPKTPPAVPLEEPETTATTPTEEPTTPTETAAEAEAAAAKTVEERVNDAVALLGDPKDQASVQKAIGALEAIVREAPSVAMAHFNLGVAYHLANKAEEARREYQAAVNLDPAVGHAWLYLGLMQEQSGRIDSALTNYRTGIRNDPENMDIRTALIALLRRQGQLDEAISEAKAALRVNANSLEVYNNMGLAYLDQGELALAKFVYQKASNIDADAANKNAYLQTNYGWVLYRNGERGPALGRLQKAVELDPNLVPALIYLSKLYMEDRNYQDTIDLLERAAAQAPDNHGVQMNLGIAYRGVGRFPESEKAYRKALELEPGNPDPYLNLGILHGDYLKDYKAAIDDYRAYLNGGGAQTALVQGYLDDTEKEMSRAEKRKKAEAERKEREREREERKKMLEEAAKQPQPEPGTAEPETPESTEPETPEPETPEQPEGGSDQPEPEPEPAPEPAGDVDPWGAPTEEPPAPEPAPPEPAPAEPPPPEPTPEPIPEPAPGDDNPWGPQ